MNTRRLKWRVLACGVLAALLLAIGFPRLTRAASAPSEIKIGTLYASTGTFAVASQGQFDGLNIGPRKSIDPAASS